MTHSEYLDLYKRARWWTGIVYCTTAVSLAVLLFNCCNSRAFDEMSMVFRDQGTPLADDGYYGGMVGLLFGVFCVLPSMLLPLIPVVWIHRRFGVVCRQCGTSLTLWQRTDQVLKRGTCGKCNATLFGANEFHDTDEIG